MMDPSGKPNFVQVFDSNDGKLLGTTGSLGSIYLFKMDQMEIFNGQNIVDFAERFQSDLDCKNYLSEEKWSTGHTCRKYGHHGSQVRKEYSRTCN